VAKRIIPWENQMIYTLFICSLLFFIVLKTIKKSLSRSITDPPSTKLSVVKGLLHFITVFVCIASLFCVLQFWLDHATNIDKTQASLGKFELTEQRITNIVKYVKIPWYADIVVIAALITMAGSFPIIEKYKLEEKYKKLVKGISAIVYVLTISSSFTFFGQKFSEKENERIAKLQFHKLQIIEDNQLFLQNVKENVTEQAVNEMLNNPRVQAILSKIEKEDSILSKNALPFRKKYESTAEEGLAPREWIELRTPSSLDCWTCLIRFMSIAF
jgi:hypothetical protein